jgi:predicted N-acyltransferase
MDEPALLTGFGGIDADEWDAQSHVGAGRPVDPFMTHRFLAALESSGSVGPGTGWQARPLVIRHKGRIVAATPLFVKTHSQGEYVFDHGWAEAFQRAGGQYYPKLQIAVPFTPVTGPRFLGAKIYRQSLMQAAIAIASSNGLSSLHVTFCASDEAGELAAIPDVLPRLSQQYHWENSGYADFDDFLARLSSRKRKMIRREREVARSHGLTIRAMTGDEITPAYWQAMWEFYQDTGARKWGQPYLTRSFFDALDRQMRDDVLLVMAFDGARPVAGALNFIGRDTLFGRYWGSTGDYPCLHFELCYYQAMDYAIAHGLRVEAGAQGEHKIARGYLPAQIHSLHWITDPGFRRAVADYLDHERNAVTDEIQNLISDGPFRKPEPTE